MNEFWDLFSISVEGKETVSHKETTDGQRKLLTKGVDGHGAQVKHQVYEQGDPVHERTGGNEEVEPFSSNGFGGVRLLVKQEVAVTGVGVE